MMRLAESSKNYFLNKKRNYCRLRSKQPYMNGHLANLNTSQHEKLWCHEMYYLKNLTKRLLPFR